MAALKELQTEQLVQMAVRLDQEQKKGKAELDAVKAELQGRGLRVLEDRNIKYIKYYAPEGSVAVQDSQSLDILNVDKLKQLISEGVWKSKVKETTETKYRLNTQFERMLKAVFSGDFTFEYTLEEFLNEMSLKPDEKQKKVLMKKLKGDYEKDKQVLMNVFGYTDDAPDLDVELWYIYKIKNGELIKSFLPEEFLDKTIEGIRKCIIVDTKTSITVDYSKEEL